MIKQWFNNLSEREQRIVGIGGIVAVVLIFYALIWSPLQSLQNNAEKQAQQSRYLLNYMVSSAHQIQALRQQGFSLDPESKTALLQLVDQKLTQKRLKRFLLHPIKPKGLRISMQFGEIPFDQLMGVLGELWRQDNVIVWQMKTVATKIPGAVDTEIVLGRAK